MCLCDLHVFIFGDLAVSLRARDMTVMSRHLHMQELHTD